MRVSFIGLGNMGSAIVERFHNSGIDVSGFDLNADARLRLRNQGIQSANDIAAVLEGRDVVCTCLPNSNAVRKVCMGAEGLLSKLVPGSLLIELSTIDPGTMRVVASAASDKGIDVLDCPISGSPELARQGEIVLIVGGDEKVAKRYESLLQKISKSQFYAGQAGTAKVVKIVNNMMSIGNILVASEAFSLGRKAGVDAKRLYDILSQSGGRSDQFNRRFPKVLKGDFAPGFTLELAEKDLKLGLELGRVIGAPLPAAELSTGTIERALSNGFKGLDMVALAKFYDEWLHHNPMRN